MPQMRIGRPVPSALPNHRLIKAISITILEAAQSAPPVGSIVQRHWWRGEELAA